MQASRAQSIPGLQTACVVLLLLTLGAGFCAWERTALHTPAVPGPAIPALQSIRLNINRATAAELSVLPGVGNILAARIVKDREANGRFDSLADLDRVPGLGEVTIERIAPFIRFE